jgi:hypothetical protein
VTVERIGTVIAERRLVVRDSGELVRVSLGAPRRRQGEADWACPFRIHGAGISRVEHGYGVDSMQALTTALEGIRVLLDESGLALGWKGIFDDETGFARSIPIALGGAFSRRLERLLDREIRQHVRRRSHRRTRQKAAKSR